MNIKETRVWEIREELSKGKIDIKKALVMAKYAREQVLELYQGEANLVAKIRECTDPDSPDFDLHHNHLFDYQRLGELVRELEKVFKELPMPKILIDAEELNRVIRQQDGTYRVVKSLPDVLSYFEDSSVTYDAVFIREYIRKKDGHIFTDKTIEQEIKNARARRT
jgi:hypothetical protein